jgi:hypothetical protein
VLVLQYDSITITKRTNTNHRMINPAILLLLLAFGVFFEVFCSDKKVSSRYCSVMRHAPEGLDFPLSIPFSTKEEPSGMEVDFSEDDDNLINLVSIQFFVSEPTYFNQHTISPIQESLHPPFTPPESVTLIRM